MIKRRQSFSIVIFIFFLFALSLYFYSTLRKKHTVPFPVLHATPALTPGYQKVYGEGNNIIYNSSIRLTFGGSGYVRTTGKDSNTRIEYIVGRFVEWNKIPNSDDKYILVKEYNSDKIHKARSTWNSKTSSSTLLVKEDVSKIGTNGLEKGYLLRAGTIDNEKELYAGRIISVLLKMDKEQQTVLIDSNGIPFVDAVIIR